MSDRLGLALVMGIGRTWRHLRALRGPGRAPNQDGWYSPGSVQAPRGLGAGLFSVMADALAPLIAATAESRGGPLPGSDAAVVDGSAWAQLIGAGAAALRARDAAFDPALLESFAGQVFAAVNAVWAEADAGSARPVLADALWEPLAASTGVHRKRAGFAAFGLQRATARVAGLHAGALYDSALVIMDVRIDVTGPAPPRKIPAEMRQWAEDWLFQRSVRIGGDPMIRPPACPSCGAPTHVDEAGQCTHCGVPTPFLTTGWLVTGIVSRHPSYALARAKRAEQMRNNPMADQQMPPDMMGLLPPGMTLDGFIDQAPPGWAPARRGGHGRDPTPAPRAP